MRSIHELIDLSGRKALVTGGGGHIGSILGETLVELGATVSLLDIDARLTRRAVRAILRVRPDSAFGVHCDLRSERSARGAVNKVIRKMGGLDILVHCAAYVGTTRAPGWAVPFEKQTVKAFQDALKVNLLSAFVLAQEARTALSASGRGSLILIGSTYGLVGPDPRLYEDTSMNNPVGYGASKGGLLQMTRYLATLLAPSVRVNAISPGGVWRQQPKTFHRRYVARTPLRRMAAEEDLKGAVAYLAGDASGYVTGHNLVVDGGWTAW